MTEQEAITIVLPVYGRPDLLTEALNSVVSQDNEGWNLLIADDGSDQHTQTILQQWMETNDKGRMKWVRRPNNMGLFANLNQALLEIETEWAVLLCSDDRLHAQAISTVLDRRRRWPEAELILSTFDSFNADGSPRPKDSAWHHNQVSHSTTLIQPSRLVKALLQLGSLNGNLTGMAFSRTLWQAAGPFREEWRHAADWEWLLRAAEEGPVVLNRESIAEIRTHDEQLSNKNRKSGHEILEVAEVVGLLKNHPMLSQEPRRQQWAAHIMQFQLWNTIKASLNGQSRDMITRMRAIQRSAGLIETSISMLKFLPSRFKQRFNKDQIK